MHVTYTPCSCGLTWHRHPVPVETLSHRKKADKEKQEKFMRHSRQQGEKENGNIRQIKWKCARPIRTRRWRPLDLLPLEARAFSVSAWGAGRKSWKRLQSESGKGSVRGVVVVQQVKCFCGCQAKKAQTLKKQLMTTFGTTKHHSEIKDGQERLTDSTIHSYTKASLARQICWFLNGNKGKLIPGKNGSIFPKAGRQGSGRTSGQSSPCMQTESQRPTLVRLYHTHIHRLHSL